MENELSAKESLEIISRSIQQAKKNVGTGGSFQILLWGWIVTLANFGHYSLTKMDYPAPYIVWLLIIPGVIISTVYGYRLQKKSRIMTHMDSVYNKIWLAIFFVIMTVVVFMSKLNFNHNPVILGIVTVGMYTTGTLLRFKPIIIGAVILWVGTIVAFSVSVTNQYLVSGITMIVGYLIPGYLLKRAEH